MSIKYVLFDLDGTLIDSKPGIISCLKTALFEYDAYTDHVDFNQFIGPPLMNSLVDVLQIDPDRADMIVKRYRTLYGEKGLYDSILYEGIHQVLMYLTDNGFELMVATSKPIQFARVMLEHFDISSYFSWVSASDFARTYDTKQRVITDALEHCNITDYNQVIMVGDRNHDIIAAKAVGIKSLGVLYGYGDRVELESAGADFIVRSPSELTELFHTWL